VDAVLLFLLVLLWIFLGALTVYLYFVLTKN